MEETMEPELNDSVEFIAAALPKKWYLIFGNHSKFGLHQSWGKIVKFGFQQLRTYTKL